MEGWVGWGGGGLAGLAVKDFAVPESEGFAGLAVGVAAAWFSCMLHPVGRQLHTSTCGRRNKGIGWQCSMDPRLGHPRT